LEKVINDTATSSEKDSAYDLLWEMGDTIDETALRLGIDLHRPEYGMDIECLIRDDLLNPDKSVQQYCGFGSDEVIADMHDTYEETLKYWQQYLRDIRSVLMFLDNFEPEYLPVVELMEYLNIGQKHYYAVYKRLERLRDKDKFGDLFKEIECSGGRQPRYLWNVKKITPRLQALSNTA